MYEPVLLFRQPNELSEGPVWDEKTSTLYWLDVLAGRLWRSRFQGHQPAEPELFCPSTRVASIGLAEDGSFVGSLEEGVSRFAWGGEPTLLTKPTFDTKKMAYNDGKVGPDGAFWVGAKDRAHREGIAPLERITAEGGQEVRATGLMISNGLDWSPDGKWFYLTDSPPRVIWRYRWDAQRAAITDRELFCDGSEAPGVPDGLTVDAEGCLWSARWGGSQLVRLSPKGEVLTRIAFPVSRVSSCILGGPDLKTLFVTTAKEDLSTDERRTEVLSGSIFSVRVDVPGLPTRRWGVSR